MHQMGLRSGVLLRGSALGAGALEATPEGAAVARDRVVGATPAATVQTRPWHRVALGAILALAAFLDFFRLDREGLGNLYYATAVRSMLTSWHNFFFVSFDP